MINKVALYLRKSRDDENETIDETLARHETLLKDYCKRNNLSIIAIYKEVVSGENITNRPQMQKLLKDVKLGLYDGVVCVEIERLSRGSQIDQVEILETFKASNTKIYTLQKTFDLSDENIDEDFLEFSLFMSRREYKIINRRMQRGRLQAMKEGYFIAPLTPYGYDKENDGRGFVLVPNSEADTVKSIFTDYAGGQSVHAIAKSLNERGLLTRKGGKWSYTTIKQILINPVYIGKIHTKDEIGAYEGKHAPIVSADLFNACQALRKAKAPKVRYNNELKNPLAGLMYCGICGSGVVRSSNGLGVTSYKCRNTSCACRGVVCSSVENTLIEHLKKELSDFNYILDNYGGDLKNKRKERDENIAKIEKAIAKQQKALNVACEMLESGVYSVDLFKARSASIESNIASLNTQLETLKGLEFTEDVRAKKAVPILSKALEQYGTLSIKDKNALLKRIIKRIDYKRLNKNFTLDVTLLI